MSLSVISSTEANYKRQNITTKKILAARKYDRARSMPSSSSPAPTSDARTPVVERDCRRSSGSDSVLLKDTIGTTHLGRRKAAAAARPIMIERMV